MPLGSRPPPLPKGVPHPYNSKPKPPGPGPKGQIWAQGKWRNPASKAVKHVRKENSRQVENALHEPDRGEKIYAYCHLRTNQVVYSLTKSMQNGQIMPQLLYHGKKTRPAALRRDLWTPYFSLQFSSPRLGKLAYAQLRELSALHQLLPEESRITNTEEFTDYMFKRKGKGYDPNDETSRPRNGQIMPKKWRARVLMDQKAVSVADAAFVIGLQDRAPEKAESERIAIEKRIENFEQLGSKAKVRALTRMAELKKKAREREKLRKQYSTSSVYGGINLNSNTPPEIGEAMKRYKRELDFLEEHYNLFKVAIDTAAVNGVSEIEDDEEVSSLAHGYLRGFEPDTAASGKRTPSEDELKECVNRIETDQNYRRDVLNLFLRRRRDALIGILKTLPAESGYHFNLTPFYTHDGFVVSEVPSDSSIEHIPILSRPALAHGTVKVLWSTLNDAKWVEEWPPSTVHGVLTSGKRWGRNAHVFGEEEGELKKSQEQRAGRREAKLELKDKEDERLRSGTEEERDSEDDGKDQGSDGDGKSDREDSSKPKPWYERAGEERARRNLGWLDRLREWLPGRKSANVV
ncbi:MAG: hypothetical protein Q9227_005562 [Pyrenula ochraceoflavens]